MRKNAAKRITACPRLFAAFSMFWGINGRRTVGFNTARNASHKAIARRVCAFASILFWLCLWVFPSQALAEWDAGDSSVLTLIHQNTSSIRENSYLIESNTDAIESSVYRLKQLGETDSINLRRILQSLGYVDDYGASLSSLYNDLLAVKSGLNVLNENDLDKLDYLQRIEDFLSNIESALESGSGSSGSAWAKETTLQSYKDDFSAYSDNFQTYYDWMRSSLGYEGGSSGSSLKISFDYLSPANSYRYAVWATSLTFDSGDTSPFPVGTNGDWGVYYVPFEASSYRRRGNSFIEDFAYIQAENTTNQMNIMQRFFQKQSWNDWYAHTNLVSTLERLLDYQPPENRIDSTSDIGMITQSQNGGEVLNITYDSGTGDSPESIDLTPAYTNNVAQLSIDADDIKKDFDDIWDYDRIKERYVDSEKFNNTSSFQDVQQSEVSNYTIQYGDKPYMTFKWSSTALRMYKAIFTYERMRLLRSTFGRMWNLLVIWGCYVLFRILGKANA